MSNSEQNAVGESPKLLGIEPLGRANPGQVKREIHRMTMNDRNATALALVGAQKSMTARPDKLYIVVNRPTLRRLFSILNLDKFFHLYVSAGDAVAAAVKDGD